MTFINNHALVQLKERKAAKGGVCYREQQVAIRREQQGSSLSFVLKERKREVWRERERARALAHMGG